MEETTFPDLGGPTYPDLGGPEITESFWRLLTYKRMYHFHKIAA